MKHSNLTRPSVTERNVRGNRCLRQFQGVSTLIMVSVRVFTWGWKRENVKR